MTEGSGHFTASVVRLLRANEVVLKVESVNCSLIQKSNRGHILIDPAARRNPHQQPSRVFEFLPQAFSRSSEGKDFAEFAGPRGLQRPAPTCAFALTAASDLPE